MRWMTAALDRFNGWFASAAGVWHTFFFCVAVVAAEYAWPALDPHGFWLLFYLTVYSAVTQPALAYVGRKSGEQQGAILAHLQAVLEHIDKHEPCSCRAGQDPEPPGS
jgi:hypothetical protein